jgi:protein TonB
MRNDHPEKDLVKRPYYPGGTKAMKAFIADNLRYPKEALEKKIEGMVAVRYEINYKGTVINVKLISTLGYGCDEEAKRLVKLLKFEVAKNRKLKLKFFKNLQIHFKLPPTPEPLKITYQETVKSTKKTEKSAQSYHYTIKF